MKRKELEEFKKRWEENLGGLGEMLNSPWFAVSIKYDEAEKNKCCIKLGQYVLRYWAQLHGVDLSPYGDKEITTDEFKQAVTKAQTEMKTDFEGGEGNAENNILDQLKRRLNIILFGTTKPEEDQKIKLGKNDLLSASNVVFFDELLKTDTQQINQMYFDDDKSKTADLNAVRDLLDKRQSLSDQIEQLEQEKTAIEQQVKLEMQDAAYGTAPGYKVSWVSSESKRVDSQRLKKEQPDIFNRYSKNVSSRRFTIIHAA